MNYKNSSEIMLSIVIPVYNADEYLEEALNSVIQQTSECWECILVDDDSSDNSVKICEYFIRLDRRFRFAFKSPLSKGANACRNAGLKACRTDYVIFMDADDLLAPQCVEKRVMGLSGYPNYDFIIFSTAIIDTDGKVVGDFKYEGKSSVDLLCSFIKHEIPWQTMSPVWKKEFLDQAGAWNESYPRLQDVELSTRALFRNPSYLLLNYGFDSFYRRPFMSEKKIKDTFLGFNLFITDYYSKLLSDSSWIKYEKEISDAFIFLIERIVRFYVGNSDRAVLGWESDFLSILKAIKLDAKDIDYLENIFMVCNADRQLLN